MCTAANCKNQYKKKLGLWKRYIQNIKIKVKI